jgi:hypothetical protein
LVYHAYDEHGNVELFPPHGLRTAYVWGECHAPVAKVEHAKANRSSTPALRMFLTPVRKLRRRASARPVSGHYTIPASSLLESRATIGCRIGSKWHNPWVQEERIANYQPGNPITTNAIDGYLDEVRLCPVEAMMTTFTYQPLVGQHHGNRR